MPQIIEQLYCKFYQSPNTEKEKQRLQTTMGVLKQRLSKWQKKMLLRVTDEKDLICAIKTQDSFEQGFRLGVKLTAEIYQKGGISHEDLDMPLF